MVTQETRAVVGVVEDDAAARTALARLLHVAGFAPAVFESAEDFIAAPPAQLLCLIVDVQLPGMSGIDLHHRLRKGGFPSPVILMTGHCEQMLRDHAERTGCAGVLSKPFTADCLFQLIRSLDSSLPARPVLVH